jgi:hypothetical protein
MTSIASAKPVGFTSRNSMQNVAEPAPMSTSYSWRLAIRWRLEELELAVVVEHMAWSWGKVSVWRKRCRESPNCGSPVVTGVLAHCSTDEAVNSMLSSWSELVDARETSLNGRFVTLFRAAVDDGFPPLEVTAPGPVVDELPSASSVASRLLRAISAKSGSRKSPHTVVHCTCP